MTELPSTAESAPIRSVEEERANALTHGVGVVLSLLGVGLLARAGLHLPLGDAIVFLIFGVTLVGLYTVSTLSHAIPRSDLQDRLRAWDQGAVYLVIAATYTPFIWAGATPVNRVLILAVVWCVGGLGFWAKVFAGHRVNSMQTYSYVLFGWVPAVFLKGTVNWPTFVWIAAGGVSYTVGVVFLKWDHRFRYFHAAWHLCVLGGSGCHFYAIYHFVVVPRMVATS